MDTVVEDSPVVNPITGDPVSDHSANSIRELRKVRSGSRRAMRSGHPAKRAEASRVNAMIPGMITQVYAMDARNS